MALVMTPDELGDTLAALDLSPAEAATALGVSPRTVYSWLDGSRPCQGPPVVALACLRRQREAATNIASRRAERRAAAAPGPTPPAPSGASGGQHG